jgi:hypothetical protein
VAMHEKHPAKLMIWEETPLPAVIERLRKMGIEPVAFETCASAPASGDYMSAMYANAKRFGAALAEVASERDNSTGRSGQPLTP